MPEDTGNDHRVQARPKKSLTAGALDLARRRGTAHPLLKAYLQARQVNQAAGGTVIAPWEVDELPEEWLDAAEALIVETVEMRQGYAEIEDHLGKWRAEHRQKNG